MAPGTAPPPKSPLPASKTTSVFPSVAVTAPKAASQPTHTACMVPGAPPALPSPKVAALLQKNASLRQQLAAQGWLLEAQKTEITSLQSQLSMLEQKLEAGLDRLSTSPSSIASASDIDTQPAARCVGKRKRYTTPLKSLHLSEEIQAVIKTAQADFERRLDSRLNSVHQLLTTQHEALNSLLMDIAAYPSTTYLQSLQASEQSYPFTPALPTPSPLPDAIFYTSNNLTLRIHLTSSCSRNSCSSHLIVGNVDLLGCVADNQVANHPARHPVTAILTRRTLTVNLVDLPFPAKRADPSLFILNVYKRARVTEDSSLLGLLCVAAVRAAKSPFLILGDFTVKHTDFGCPKADGPGTRLSVCRDTTPNLSYCCYVRDVRWSNTHPSLSSDHYVLTMPIYTYPCKPRPHVIRHTDWDAFSDRRPHSATPDIKHLSQWNEQLLADLDSVTASMSTTVNRLAIDSRLVHLQNKKRHNRRLRRQIAALYREIETHTTTLPTSSGNSSAQYFPVSCAASNPGISYAIFSTLRPRSRSPGSNCSATSISCPLMVSDHLSRPIPGRPTPN
ncbi:hypothetical protein HPB52_006151 [Rhipicephalus sanguineus]|uniref:Tick transposon n=1 Tax=Rhipicephalus sanguineus TaxID=34632 RepID=A0A9D4PFA6_RHISA|nr:hypothetical protein HPB52_006151 [Rhipicephalus sanguineus]